MEGAAEPESGEATVHPLWPVLYAQTRLLDTLIQRLADQPHRPIESDEVLRVTMLMIQALGVSIHSVIRLTQSRDMSIRDCFGIARSVSELAVNICYIAAGGPEVAQRAGRHALQKSYRDLQREGDIGGTSFKLGRTNVPAVEDVLGLAEALSEFTGRKGQENTDWTPLKISSRIEEVGKVSSQAALALSGSTVSVYRHASELLHGTYFGVVHFWSGSGRPATTRGSFEDRWGEHFVAIFGGIFFAAQAVVEFFGSSFDLPDLLEDQKQLILVTNKIVENLAAPR